MTESALVLETTKTSPGAHVPSSTVKTSYSGSGLSPEPCSLLQIPIPYPAISRSAPVPLYISKYLFVPLPSEYSLMKTSAFVK